MNKNKKYLFAAALLFTFAAFCVSAGFFPETRHQKDNKRPNTVQSEKAPSETPKSETPQNISADAAAVYVTKYILKYYDGKVWLISEYNNQKTTRDEIEEIDVTYLTETDINLLENGITLNSAESVYRLIEDYSS